MKKTKLALFHSVIALMLCCSMLVGTTYAWFTDSVESANNVIKAGNLDVELQYSYDCENWAYVGADPIIDDTLWEPGHTEVVYLRVENAGTLALKYHLGINIVDEKGSYNQDGKAFLLSDYIQFGVVEDVTAAYGTREAARAAVTSAKKISAGFDMTGSVLKGATDEIVALVVYMPEEVKNEANHATGVDAPEIKLGVNVYATQETEESDSFNSNYDAGATLPVEDLHFTVAMPIAGNVDAGALINGITLGSEEGDIFAEVPAGVKLEDGVNALTLIVETMDPDDSEADVNLKAGEVAVPLNIHVEGLDNASNDVPLTVTLNNVFQPYLNDGNIKMYHVEKTYIDNNGVVVSSTNTVEMTRVYNVADVDTHNEFYYDISTGNVVLVMENFSEVVPVINDYNPWNGYLDFDWYTDPESDKYYVIKNADQLAAFGAIVDGGYNNVNSETEEWVDLEQAEGIKPFDFADAIVKLGSDINMNTREGLSFNPIGFGYDYAGYNSGGKEGHVFRGTFDGGIYENGELVGNYTISNLNVNGWDLGISYSNSGGGLFASVCDATIKNLTMSNANIVMECVEQGVIAGLAQGTCTFENINIYGCSVANYQRATGGVVGEVSPKYNADGSVDTTNAQTCTFSQIDIDSTTVIGSLWGDFDAPVGGVVGARWDDYNATSIVMNTVNVACRLDVYNDVTSTYQWYAYRRAGMLIGNTEEADGRTATASFLKCTNVFVYYGDWVNYHYCEFFTANQPDGRENWPWVRVEAGENCNAYSNPRYGYRIDIAGTEVHDSLHKHSDSEGHLELLPFNQLYGGGQGVYGGGQGMEVGDELIDGVIVGDYTITYIDQGEVFHVDFVKKGETPKTLTETELSKYVVAPKDAALTGWIDNHGKTYGETGPSEFSGDTILYPAWSNKHYVLCFDMYSNVVYSELLTGVGDTALQSIANNVNSILNEIQTETDISKEIVLVKWEQNGKLIDSEITASDLKNASSDILLIATPTLPGTVITLVRDESVSPAVFRVTDVVESKEYRNIPIPSHIGTEPVVEIGANTFAGYENLVSVVIPDTIESIGANAFEDGPNWTGTGGRSTVTLYYDGDANLWKQYMDLLYANQKYSYYKDHNTVGTYSEDAKTILTNSWDSGLGDGSRIFFIGEDGKVDNSCYWELYNAGLKKNGSGLADYGYIYVWVFHNHEYVQGQKQSHDGCDYVSSKQYTNYKTDTIDGKIRPDAKYWN